MQDAGRSPESECVEEMACFQRGGLPGLARLQLVLPSLFAYYKIVGAGLIPVRTAVDVTFQMPADEMPDDIC